jgi:hypothetical protein
MMPRSTKRIPARERVRDWYIVLESSDPRANEAGGGKLSLLRGDEQDAIAELVMWADIIALTGQVPRSMDWQAEPMCAIIRRQSPRSFRVRCDSFEVEGDNGMTEGYGWLRLREAPDDPEYQE